MRVNFEIVYTDENDEYFHSNIPPAYVYDVFADMKNVSLENMKKEYSKLSEFSFDVQIESTTTVKNLLDEIIDKMEIDHEKFYMCSSLVHIKTDKHIIGINKYGIFIRKICDMFDVFETINILFVFSKLQGNIWTEGKIRYYMQSHESGSHNKPHVHVNIDHKYDISVDITNGKVLVGTIPQKYEKEISKKIYENKCYLISCWNTMTDGLKIDLNYGLGVVEYR